MRDRDYRAVSFCHPRRGRAPLPFTNPVYVRPEASFDRRLKIVKSAR